MAGRIRSIKPEVLEDETASGLSDAEWRVWVSSWVLADDYGRFRASPKYIASQVWQDTGRTKLAEKCLHKLQGIRFLRLYEIDGQQYAELKQSGWRRHQKIDHPSKPRVPAPNDSGGLTPIPREDTRDSRDVSTEFRDDSDDEPRDSETLGPRARAQDHRPGPPTTDQDPDHEPDHSSASPPVDGESERPESDANAIREVFEYWRAKLYPNGKPKFDDQRRRRIRARLSQGFGVDELKQAVDGALRDPWLMGTDPKSKPEGYRDVKTVFRDASQVERLMVLAAATAGPSSDGVPDPETTRRFIAERKAREAGGTLFDNHATAGSPQRGAGWAGDILGARGGSKP